MNTVLRRIHQVLEKAEEQDRLSRIFDWFILSLIMCNVFVIILETEPAFKQFEKFFRGFEVFSVIVFTIEYVLRLINAPFAHPNYSIRKAVLKRAKSPLLVIDLLAILPFYIPLFVFDLRFLRIFRVFRFLRILKLNRYSNAMALILKVIKNKKEALLSSFYILFLIMTLSSIFMYYIESAAQPEAFSSIIATFWWGIATLTTIGYGDVYPITPLGKLLASIIAISSIGIVALPTGIISSGFIEQMNLQQMNARRQMADQEDNRCPHCGKPIKKKKTPKPAVSVYKKD